MQSFKSWEEAENHDLEEMRKTTPEERLKILYDLISLQEKLPIKQKEQGEDAIPTIHRNKK